MKEKITRESVAGQRLIFFPKSEDECAHLQQGLFNLGLHWANGQDVVQNTAAAVKNGLVLLDGVIFYRSDVDTGAYTSCSIAQVDADYLPPEQRLMVDLFNKLSAKVDALSEKVDRLYAEVHPEIADTKPGLKKPAPAQQGGL